MASVTLLSEQLGSRRVDGRWGIDVGEPPWDLFEGSCGDVLLDHVACSRVPELRGARQRSAALIQLGDGRGAWVTSGSSGWNPDPPMREVLRLLSHSYTELQAGPAKSPRASTAAHDIRNQLSLALLRLERLEGPSDAEVAPLRGALRAGRSMCNAFLEGAGAHADFALRPVLEEEIRAALDSSGRPKLSVALRCGAESYAHSSESSLRRFVQNGLSNALAVAPVGARIRVEVLSSGPGSLEVAVEDDGAGLGPQRVERAFQARASGRGSTGLGTESILQAARDLGSALTLETAPGAGSRLSVKIRAARSERPVAILLDGDPRLCPRVREGLESKGWWVVCADGVEDAVGGMDRWGASLVVTRRGSGYGAYGAIGAEAEDLGIEHLELCRGDDGASALLPA